MEAIVPTTIGGKVLATAANGERFAILETEIVTPAIGDIDLAIPATSWTGQAITRISQPTDFAAVGSREENAKNAALPEPVTIEARIIIPHITKSMIRPCSFHGSSGINDRGDSSRQFQAICKNTRADNQRYGRSKYPSHTREKGFHAFARFSEVTGIKTVN